MASEIGVPGNGGQPLPAPELPVIRIEMRPDRRGVNVRGPLADKLLCWRMLTDAAAAILNFRPPGEIVVPAIQPPDLGRPS